MELLIIKYTLATIIAIYWISLPYKIILMLKDIPNTLWIIKKWKWKINF